MFAVGESEVSTHKSAVNFYFAQYVLNITQISAKKEYKTARQSSVLIQLEEENNLIVQTNFAQSFARIVFCRLMFCCVSAALKLGKIGQKRSIRASFTQNYPTARPHFV